MNWRRRTATLAGMMLALTLAAGAADASRRVAFLTLGLQENYPAFVDGLRRLGYAQGRNLDIDYRYGPVEKLEPLARAAPPHLPRPAPSKFAHDAPQPPTRSIGDGNAEVN